jgi:hypothetical protein
MLKRMRMLFVFIISIAILSAFCQSSEAGKKASRQLRRRPSINSPLVVGKVSTHSRSYQAISDQAIVLRNHWRPWAQQHKDTLVKMLLAPAGDYAPLATVCGDLPAEPILLGETSNFGISYCDLYSRNGIFSWQPKLLYKARFDSSLGRIVNIRPIAVKLLENDFRGYRDIQISRSVSSNSPYSVGMWASGRITLSKRLAGASIVTREIQPPYPFLRTEIKRASINRLSKKIALAP